MQSYLRQSQSSAPLNFSLQSRCRQYLFSRLWSCGNKRSRSCTSSLRHPPSHAVVQPQVELPENAIVTSELCQHSSAAMEVPPALAPIVSAQLLALAGLSLLLERAPASRKSEAGIAPNPFGTYRDSRTHFFDVLPSCVWLTAGRPRTLNPLQSVAPTPRCQAHVCAETLMSRVKRPMCSCLSCRN